jgi:2',3'-cyclic-nucleotide 2'-phosphodiesterase
MDFKILLIGDIVGSPGRYAVEYALPRLVERHGIDFVIANAENAAGGSGLTPDVADDLFMRGVHCITMGDHVWRQKEIVPRLETDNRILRPANFSKKASGKGYALIEAKGGVKVAVMQVLGRIFMNPINDPFEAVDEMVADLSIDTPIIVLDMHAEATSEKVAMGWYLDGRVSAVIGTHTHIQTADEKILPKGTAYLTDTGMTGPYDSVIGRVKEKVIAAMTTQMPRHFDVAENDIHLGGALITVDTETGRAKAIERVFEPVPTKV